MKTTLDYLFEAVNEYNHTGEVDQYDNIKLFHLESILKLAVKRQDQEIQWAKEDAEWKSRNT